MARSDILVKADRAQLGKLGLLNQVPPHIHAQVALARIAQRQWTTAMPGLHHLKQPVRPAFDQQRDQRRVAVGLEIGQELRQVAPTAIIGILAYPCNPWEIRVTAFPAPTPLRGHDG